MAVIESTTLGEAGGTFDGALFSAYHFKKNAAGDPLVEVHIDFFEDVMTPKRGKSVR